MSEIPVSTIFWWILLFLVGSSFKMVYCIRICLTFNYLCFINFRKINLPNSFHVLFLYIGPEYSSYCFWSNFIVVRVWPTKSMNDQTRSEPWCWRQSLHHCMQLKSSNTHNLFSFIVQNPKYFLFSNIFFITIFFWKWCVNLKILRVIQAIFSLFRY